MNKKVKILDDNQLDRKINRLAWEIYEKNLNETKIVLIGVASRGLKLAKDLASSLEEISKTRVKVGSLELDKDNLVDTEIKLDLPVKEYKDQVVILCDDVLNSGKTLMYVVRYFLDVSVTKLSTLGSGEVTGASRLKGTN